MTVAIDTEELEAKVKEMYRQVAENPAGAYHFETGRTLAEQLGYDARILDRLPAGAVESFAGVGHFFDLADLSKGEWVIDLGSGSGMDTFYAAELVGPSGGVVGVDFTQAQLEKARRLANGTRVEFREGRIEQVPAPSGTFDCVISNGVINLSADKARVFAEAARLLCTGGRLVVADIVSEQRLNDTIVANTDLWASCIGGAEQEDSYRQAVEAAGLHVRLIRRNRYGFLSESARNASSRYGVKSVSLLAIKPSR